jgi:transcriptional regulator with XRE-family HTH domain
MKRSAKVAGITRQEMAEYLDVAPETVSTWMNDRIVPSTQTLRLWAMRTGAPFEWLTTAVRPEGFEPPTFCSAPDGPDAVVTSIYSHMLDRADTPKDAA